LSLSIVLFRSVTFSWIRSSLLITGLGSDLYLNGCREINMFAEG
jgi:hypothetical protein